MVENLLSVTRIDGAKAEIVKTPTVLDELIDSVLMKFSKKHPNQKVITQIPEEFVDIPMDSLLIEQVLLNLLENAVFHASRAYGQNRIAENLRNVRYIGRGAAYLRHYGRGRGDCRE